MTFYQKKAFIDILADQLKKMTLSYHLNVEQLNNLITIEKRTDLKNIRKFIVESLIKLNLYFIKSAYDNVLSEQEIAYQTLNKVKYDENELNKKANGLLMKKEVISINVIKPSLVFFNEDGNNISIIITCEKDSKEYKELHSLYNLGISEKKYFNELIDYKAIDNLQFLEEIKKFLDLKNNIKIDDIKFKYNNIELENL